MIIDFPQKNVNSQYSGLTREQLLDLLENACESDFVEFEVFSFQNIPILGMIYELLLCIDLEKGLRLTPAGYLPVKIVKHLYSLEILKDEAIELGITKLSKEFDSESVHVSRLVAGFAGYIRKINNKLFVTKKGQNFANDKNTLKHTLSSFATKYNIGYLDGYSDDGVGQTGFLYSLFMLSRFGDEFREINFYGKKYFDAFSFNSDFERGLRSFSVRTFKRFFRYFGFYDYKKTKLEQYEIIEEVKKTSLLDRVVKFTF